MTKQKKRRLAIAGLACLAGLLLLPIAWLWARPSMPAGWSAISPGMSRAQILDRYPNLFTGMYAVKGIDSQRVPNTLPWVPSGHWQLSLSYTPNGTVEHVGYHYQNTVCGLFNVTRVKP